MAAWWKAAMTVTVPARIQGMAQHSPDRPITVKWTMVKWIMARWATAKDRVNRRQLTIAG